MTAMQSVLSIDSAKSERGDDNDAVCPLHCFIYSNTTRTLNYSDTSIQTEAEKRFEWPRIESISAPRVVDSDGCDLEKIHRLGRLVLGSENQ